MSEFLPYPQYIFIHVDKCTPHGKPKVLVVYLFLIIMKLSILIDFQISKSKFVIYIVHYFLESDFPH